MRIKMLTTDGGRVRPAVLCDLCGEEITDAGRAMVMWSPCDVVKLQTLVCHKQCSKAFEWPWMEFSAFWVRLADATGVDIEETRNTLQVLAEVG